MVPALAELALDYYRNPLAYRHLSDVSRPLPRGFAALLPAFGTALAGARLADTAGLLSVSADELLEASRFFVRHVLLPPGGDYYRVLGLDRNASTETIRNNYLVLIRLFHPDKTRKASPTDLSCSSRLNSAYQVLRDPRDRARYDRRLPSPARPGRDDELAALFLPRPPVVDSPAPDSQCRSRARLPGWAALGAIPLGLIGIGLAYVLSGHSSQPTLRLTTQEGTSSQPRPAPLPRYLGNGLRAGAAGSSRPDVGPADSAAAAPEMLPVADRSPATSPSATQAAIDGTAPHLVAGLPAAPHAGPLGGVTPSRMPSVSARVTAPHSPPPVVAVSPSGPGPSGPGSSAMHDEPPSAMIGARVIARLESAYNRGDADAVAALFTVSARTSDGSGRHLIRARYARLFRETAGQRLIVKRMHWRGGQRPGIEGHGRFSVSTKREPSAPWRHADGDIDISLTRVDGEYRISTMSYRLD